MLDRVLDGVLDGFGEEECEITEGGGEGGVIMNEMLLGSSTDVMIESGEGPGRVLAL